MTKLDDGVYFGLDEETYHAQPHLGSGDLKRLLINPVAWWAKSAQGQRLLIDLGLMSEPELGEDETLSKLFGRACHVRVLEPDRFDRLYVEKADMPVDYLASKSQIADELRAVGAYLPPSGAARSDFVMAAKRAGMKVSDDWKVDELIRAEGRDILSKRWMAQLNMIDHLLRAPQPALEGASIRESSLSGGYSEVSVFWHEEVEGQQIPLKARFDYLRLSGIIDVKTYGAPEDVPPVSFFLNQMARYGYDFQHAAYAPAWAQIGHFREAGQVFGDYDPAWLKRLKADKEPAWRWVAIQTLRMPEVDWLDWTASMARLSADGQRREAMASYARYVARFGLDTPWVALRGRIVVDDTTLEAAGIGRRMAGRGEQHWTVA